MDSSSFPDEGNGEGTDNHGNLGKRKVVPESEGATSKPKKGKKKDKAPKPPSTRSNVWDHFTRTTEDRDRCVCHYCQKNFACATTSGTSNLRSHLNCCRARQSWLDLQARNGNVVTDDGKLKKAKISVDVFREAANEMLVLGELPLAFIESVAFKHFCRKTELYQPISRRTLTRDIVQMFVRKKAALKKWIKSRKQRVSLTTDIWVAQSTGASYMVITMHYVDDNWELKKLIIGFKHVSDHRGVTIANVLMECAQEWGIEKIFTITVDNATANTSALRRFQREFKVNNESFVLDGEFLHVRCCAHIINLIVKDGMHDISSSVAAIRNGIQYVRSSGARLKSFELKVDAGKLSRGSLPLDIKTRWNSTHLMLTRGLKYILAFDKMESEDRLYSSYFEEKDRDTGEKRIGPPTAENWNAVERLVKFLGIFYNATLAVSTSSSVSSNECYGEIVTIEKSLMTLSQTSDSDLRGKAESMIEKFDKYWDGVKNINKMLIVASVFDPRKKMNFAKMCFEKLYGKDSPKSKEMYESVKRLLWSLFTEYSSRSTRQPSSVSTQSTQQSGLSGQEDNVVVDLTEKMDLLDDDLAYQRMSNAYEELVNEIGVEDATDELDIYLNERVDKPKIFSGAEYDVLSWWKANCTKFPILSEIAKDVLAMQVSSVASESAFSNSGRIIEPSRSCLTHYMVEVLMCTEQWLKSDTHLHEKSIVTNAQLLAEFEYQENLEREFGNPTEKD